MQILNIENCSKSYGEKVLFEGLSLTISQGNKIALIAKNGSGKTTLLRIIAGEDSSEGENSKIEYSPNVSTYYLKQNPQFEPGDTILDAVFNSSNPKIQAIKKYEQATLNNDEQASQQAMIAIDDLKAWGTEVRIKEILTKLKVQNLDQLVESLSGGQRKRLSLAKMIIDEPEFIILDEPTNHLDLEMIEWLEDYLQQASLTLFMVTHDRYFLERICNEMYELDMGKLYAYKGNYSDYLEKKTMRVQNEKSQQEKSKKLFKKELDWIRRMPKARSTKAKSRVDKFDDIKADAFAKKDEDVLSINLKSTRLGSKILEAHSISKSYDGKCIVDQFSYKFKKGERIGVVGNNGAGKSTFLNLLTKQIRPDGGKIVVGDTIRFGYYTQEGIRLNEDKRVIDVIRDIAEFIPLEKGMKMTAETLLERFLFPRHQQRVYVSQLSGGEKRRLYLLTILMDNPNFLILDEPTNDLDILTLNVLEQYLLQFPGCLLVVSHDRYFLDKLVQHIFILEGDGKIIDSNQTFTEYRANRKLEKYAATEEKPKEADHSKQESQIEREQQKKIKNRIQKIEREISNLEDKKDKLTLKFNENLSLDDIQKYSKELTKVKEDIETFEEEWMELTEQI